MSVFHSWVNNGTHTGSCCLLAKPHDVESCSLQAPVPSSAPSLYSLSEAAVTVPLPCHPDACLLPHWRSLEAARLTDRVTHQPPNGLSKNTPNLWESSISTINILVLLLQIGPGNLGICATKGFFINVFMWCFQATLSDTKNCWLNIILHPNLIITLLD